jgi:hypothetical protein
VLWTETETETEARMRQDSGLTGARFDVLMQIDRAGGRLGHDVADLTRRMAKIHVRTPNC